MSAAARSMVSVVAANQADFKATQIAIPAVMTAPVRADIVQSVFTGMNKNKRQAYGVSLAAGHQHSAESWGTGRAVARIPRVSGGGTSRAGQAAFGNMCRKGRMFAPTKTWRKWHRKININQKRYAVCSAVAASAIPALVQARGHQISNVAEVPCVVPTSVQNIKKTRDAVAVLAAVGADEDVTRCQNSYALRTGRGKMRGRRHVNRRGPLVVFDEDEGITQAFRNIRGVDLANVNRLNLLQLAPGGHLGRFVIWTEAAFRKLGYVFGSVSRQSTQKKGYTLPRNIVSNSDITRIINSDAIQSVVRPAIKQRRKHNKQKKNPLKNLGVKVRLNPYALAQRRAAILAQNKAVANKAKIAAQRNN